MNSNVKQIKFQDFSKAMQEDSVTCQNFILSNRIDSNAWESILAYLATLNKFSYTYENLIDSRLYIKENFPKDDWHLGLYLFLMTPIRGNIIYGRQVDRENLPFSGIVPLILAAHKKYNNIPYNKWSLDGLEFLVQPPLYSVMSLKGTVPIIDKDTAIEAREIGLTVKSGRRAGIRNDPKSAYNLSGIPKMKFPDIANLPKYGQVIITQVWAAHPDNRNKYMILDLNDWDNMPEPLEDSTLFEAEHPCVNQNNVQKQDISPWDID